MKRQPSLLVVKFHCLLALEAIERAQASIIKARRIIAEARQ